MHPVRVRMCVRVCVRVPCAGRVGKVRMVRSRKSLRAETWWNAAESYASPLTACHQIEFIVEC